MCIYPVVICVCGIYLSNSLSATSVKYTTLMIAIEVDSVGEYDYICRYIYTYG